MAATETSNDSMQFKDEVFTKTFRHQMVHLWKAKQHTDVILTADGMELHCHQVALSAGSGYFNAMFTSNCVESKSGIVPINDISFDTLEAIISYIYTGYIEITTGNVQQLIQASDMYQLDTLKQTCETFMVNRLGAQNCLGLNRFANIYRLDVLATKSRDYMLAHLGHCVLGPEFVELTEEELTEYIKDDHLDVKVEDPVFEAVLHWVKHDVEGRVTKLRSILQHLRVSYCSDLYLSRLMEDDIVANEPSVAKFVLRAQLSHTRPPDMDLMPRHSYPAKRCLVCIETVGTHTQQCSYFNEESKAWERLASQPSPKNNYFSVCKFNKALLITGGNERRMSCWKLDPVRKEWKELPGMATARYFHGSIQHGDRAYVVGGVTSSGDILSSVEVFCSIREAWMPTEPLITAVRSPMVATNGSNVYCFGGSTGVDGNPISRQTQMYDAVWERWSERAVMPHICQAGSAVALAEQIFLVGGCTRTCMSYSPGPDQWSLLTRPSAIHGYAPAALWRGRILLAGGNDGESKPTSLIEEYNTETDTWETWTCPLDRKQAYHYLFGIDIPAMKK